MFGFIKSALQKIYTTVTSQLATFFGKATIDEQSLQELETLLIYADTGVKTTRLIIQELKNKVQTQSIQAGSDLKIALEPILLSILTKPARYDFQHTPVAHMLVGINGSGKTTFIAKLANHYSKQGRKVLLVAADTFRAAALEQLSHWAQEIGCRIITAPIGSDPASVVFTGCHVFQNEQYDVLIIDTAGRLHTKVNLMHELAKIKKIITRQLPNQIIHTLLTVDSMLGQNSFEQAKLFKECTQIDGIVLTKMDGTGKGGIVFAITQELEIPICYLSFGEAIADYTVFNAQEYVHDLLNQ